MNEKLGIIKTFSETTKVFVQKIPTKQIEFYVNNYNTLDKAGSYGIQEWFSVWIKKLMDVIIMLWAYRYQNSIDI